MTSGDERDKEIVRLKAEAERARTASTLRQSYEMAVLVASAQTVLDPAVREVVDRLKVVGQERDRLVRALVAAETGDDIAFWQGVDRLGDAEATWVKAAMDVEKALVAREKKERGV